MVFLLGDRGGSGTIADERPLFARGGIGEGDGFLNLHDLFSIDHDDRIHDLRPMSAFALAEIFPDRFDAFRRMRMTVLYAGNPPETFLAESVSFAVSNDITDYSLRHIDLPL